MPISLENSGRYTGSRTTCKSRFSGSTEAASTVIALPNAREDDIPVGAGGYHQHEKTKAEWQEVKNRWNKTEEKVQACLKNLDDMDVDVGIKKERN